MNEYKDEWLNQRMLKEMQKILYSSDVSCSFENMRQFYSNTDQIKPIYHGFLKQSEA